MSGSSSADGYGGRAARLVDGQLCRNVFNEHELVVIDGESICEHDALGCGRRNIDVYRGRNITRYQPNCSRWFLNPAENASRSNFPFAADARDGRPIIPVFVYPPIPVVSR